jgi:uncharacterized protein (DUF1330 family)
MPAYIIARIKVTNWDKYQSYVKATPEVIKKYGGKFIVRGGEKVTLEGPDETRRIAVLEFPTLEKAKEFFNSRDYQDVRKLRMGAADAQLVAIEGI